MTIPLYLATREFENRHVYPAYLRLMLWVLAAMGAFLIAAVACLPLVLTGVSWVIVLPILMVLTAGLTPLLWRLERQLDRRRRVGSEIRITADSLEWLGSLRITDPDERRFHQLPLVSIEVVVLGSVVQDAARWWSRDSALFLGSPEVEMPIRFGTTHPNLVIRHRREKEEDRGFVGALAPDMDGAERSLAAAGLAVTRTGPHHAVEDVELMLGVSTEAERVGAGASKWVRRGVRAALWLAGVGVVILVLWRLDLLWLLEMLGG